jgi:predicted ArsR family transcriptional regulator
MSGQQKIDALDALGQVQLREAFLYARCQGSAVTARDLATGLGLPVSVARFRLERLAAAGLLTPGFERRTGRSGPGSGRPAKAYTVTPEITPIEFPQRRFERLLELLVDALPRRGRDRRLREIGAGFGRDLAVAGRLRRARSTPAALRAVAAALGRAGFHASVADTTSRGGVIETRTCPLRPLVVANPDARPLDVGMWQGLLAEALPDGRAAVSCEAAGCHDPDAPCRVRVTTAGPSARPARGPRGDPDRPRPSGARPGRARA